jgi:pimeloyl-ACP methyl ester carboxylesterase
VVDIAPVAYPPGFRAYAEAMAALPLRPGLIRREADALLAPAVPDPGVRAFLLQNLRLDGAAPAWRIGLAAIAAALPEIERFDGIPAGATYAGPTLFLGGARSDYIRPDHHAVIRARFPRAAFATVPDAGHWVHAENPAGFLAELMPFLETG